MTLPSLATAAAAAVTTDTAPPASSTSSSSWRQPSLQQCKQYNIRPVQEDFVPTTEEQMLLDFYEYMKQMERLAQRLRTEAAMEKLAAKDAAFQQQQSRTHAEIQPRKKKRKKKRERNLDDVEDTVEDDEQEMEDVSEASADNLSDDNDDDDEDDDEDEDDEARNQRREAKLAALRAEVAQAKAASILAQEEEREKLIAHHLADHKRNDDDGDDEDDMAPTILKRKRLEPVEEQQSSAALIANLTATSTPPHDFSKSLELTASRGKVLFPTDPEQIKWTPPEGVFSPNDGAFCVPLENFDPNHLQTPGYGNTLAIKFAAPADAKRFSFNIASAASERDHFENILFHFNPRQRERGGQLIVNDKNDGIWGQALALPLSQVPLMFGQTACTIMIQINGDGFDIFLESKHCARLEHRQELPTGNLVLQFPSTDDYGSPENWAVYKVWWGFKPSLIKSDVTGVPGVNQFNSLHPRKLFISGLSKIFSQSDVERRRAEFERAFAKYGGERGIVHVIVPTNATYAFVEMETERLSELALQELSSKYRMNRARWSRHEALQEERAVKEAQKQGKETKTTGEW